MADPTFALRLRRLRKMRGLSGRRLAELAGLHDAQVSRYEAGNDYDPRLSTIRKLAAALGCSASALVAE